MKKTICFIVSILVLIFSAISVSAENLPDAKVSLVPETQTIKKGDTFVLSVNFENADEYQYGIEAFTLSLEFDDSAFEFKNISFTVDESDITYNQQNGCLKVLYCFVPLNSKVGFKSSGAFCTVEFDVVDDSKTGYDFKVDFDTISVLTYDEQGKIVNNKVGFNRPQITVRKQNEPTSSNVQSENLSSVSSKPTNQSAQSVSSAVSSRLNDRVDSSEVNGQSSRFESDEGASSEIIETQSADKTQSDYETDDNSVKIDDFEPKNYNIVLIIALVSVIIVVVTVIVIMYIKKR